MIIFDLLESIDFKIDINDSDYVFNNVKVPRVTKILSAMLHEDYLMTWANVIGLYKRQKYADVIGRAANIGTNTHNLIEAYIKTQAFNITQAKTFNMEEIKAIDNGVNSFILWYDNLLKENEVEIIGMEQTLGCQWFAGTYDLLLKINGKIYLVDFKTSNHVGVRYFYQLAAYKYLLELQGIQLDGAIILQVSKKNVSFDEYVLDLHNPVHNNFMTMCTQTFFSLVYGYFNRLYTEGLFKNIFGGK